jgi:hypothetical protein
LLFGPSCGAQGAVLFSRNTPERAGLALSGRCTNCGADGQIVVHHRSPGLNTTRLLCTLYPEQPEQLELPLVTQGGSTATDLTNLEQASLFVLTG